MFLMNTMSPPKSARFSSSAPCPEGRSTSRPSSRRNGPPDGVAAIVSVEAFCTENARSNFTDSARS
jgi:hypothetical protein